ncbi:MAG: hypothetical protein K2X94_01945 [Amoebophilaceae bacterium]|nr:hypothetical protein [Amoebophilaceae bacterium]
MPTNLIVNNFGKKFHLTDYLRELLPIRNKSTIALGIYCLVIACIQLQHSVDHPIVPMFSIGLAVCIGMYPAIKGDRYGVVLVYIYPIFVFALLFLSSGYMLLIHSYNQLTTRIALTNFVVALCYLPWQVVGLMSLIAFPLIYYKLLCINNDTLWMEIAWQENQLYHTLLFFIALSIIVLYLKAKLKPYPIAISSHDHANQLTVGGKYNKNTIPESTLAAWVKQYKNHEQFLREMRYFSNNLLNVSPKPTSIQIVIDKLNHKSIFDTKKIKTVIHNHTKQLTISGDPKKLNQFLTDGIKFISHSDHPAQVKSIHLYINDTQLQYTLEPLHIYCKTLPAVAFILTNNPVRPVIEQVYSASDDDKIDDNIHILPPSHSKERYRESIGHMIDAHYGRFFIHEEADYTTVYGIVPTDLNLIKEAKKTK